MGQILHSSATTTEAVRRAIQNSQESLTTLSKRYGINQKTVAKWKKRGSLDKSTIVYNPRSTMENIPLEAYDYVVNGKPALEWVMERQCVKTDPASGIVNDANRYANETIGDPAYPLKLLQRIITVSLETMRIVRALPPLGELT
jgi:predicted helicase